MAGRVALVFCVHHKPWLMQSTLITTELQDYQGAHLHFVHNLGSGDVLRPSYAEYRRLASSLALNTQLSDYDERTREVCHLNRPEVTHLEYENDHGLDSGVWYKFIRDGRWRAFDFVAFIGEGGLLTRENSLSAMLDFAARGNVHFIGSGHEKRRLPKSNMMQRRTREHHTPMDEYHDRMIRETFDVFCRDPEFRAVFDTWTSDFPPETEDHVPDIWPKSALERRVRASIQKRFGSPFEGEHSGGTKLAHIVAGIPARYDELAARGSLWFDREPQAETNSETANIHVNGVRRKLIDVASVDEHGGVRFHRADGPEWFGLATIHVFSRTFLERLSARLERFAMYDVIDMPFAATALEVVWGFMPAWLGVDKWFTDAIHRVRKNFVTYAREDYPPEMASYINRYHRGAVAVSWNRDYLKVRAWRRDLARLRHELPAVYF